MSDVSTEAKINELSTKIDDLILGMKWMFSLFLFVISIPNLCVSLSIGHFAQIFQDALPGRPLPLLTATVIGHPVIHHLLTLAWPIAGILYIVHGKRTRDWCIGTALTTFVIGLQLCLTWLALFLPLGQLVAGMSDTGAK